MEKPLDVAWVGPKVGWELVSGDYQGRANSISQFVGVLDFAPPCTCRLNR